MLAHAGRSEGERKTMAMMPEWRGWLGSNQRPLASEALGAFGKSGLVYRNSLNHIIFHLGSIGQVGEGLGRNSDDFSQNFSRDDDVTYPGPEPPLGTRDTVWLAF
ncbi:hypothetical protein ABIB42_001904 [Massilia sp. UYP32]|uniref:hypothetical protein n=1 Tax=Massilia sp. UYP32 TaxID=1756386 RepID=UPI003D1E9ED4